MNHLLRREAEAVFHDLVVLSPERQAELLEQRCGSRLDLRGEVTRLLRATEDVMGDFMRTAPCAAPDLDELRDPERIGRYRIERRIGEGGMGLVYAARQENPDRLVALKLMRPGWGSPSLLRRFLHEVAALASLRHPGIAHIYEAGTIEVTVAGERFEQPYFAMELVDGEPLTTYAQRERLSVRQCLELLIQVCAAVQHAHQKGMIHRDLKPANILVEKSGCPKVLDFGVATALSADAETGTHLTAQGQLVGTPAYMSPEQVSGDRERLDVRSDVYSLGVVAFELLTGRLPYDIAGKTMAATIREIVETPPKTPSLYNHALRGDLETVLSRALEKDPAQRYASVHSFADDLQRVLRHEPIAARPPSALYQLRKFTRRNRGFVAGACLAFFILVAGALISAGLAIERGRALKESEKQKQIAQAVNEFLTRDLLASADPSRQPDRNISLREVLDRASDGMEDRFAGAPLIEASIRTTLSNTYKALGEYEPALKHAERALLLQQSHAISPDRETIRAMNRVASLERSLGRLASAEQRFRLAHELASELLGPEDETTLSILNNLALLVERDGRPQEAATMLERVVEIRTRTLGEQHERTMTSINNLALVYVALNRFAEAEPLYIKELDYSRREFGDEHPGTLISVNNLAVLYLRRGDFARAEPLAEQALDARLRRLGPDHPHAIESLGTMGELFARTGRYDDARFRLTEALERSTRTLGSSHPMTVRLHDQLAALQARINHREASSSSP